MDLHSEPYLCLASLTHKSALISWGAFYFRQKKDSNDIVISAGQAGAAVI